MKRYSILVVLILAFLCTACTSKQQNVDAEIAETETSMVGSTETPVISEKTDDFETNNNEKSDNSNQTVTIQPTIIEVAKWELGDEEEFKWFTVDNLIDETFCYSCSVISDGKQKCIQIDEYRGIETEVEIPDTIRGYDVIAIGEGAFYDNQTVEKVIIPEGVWKIDVAAFRNCTSLSEVKIPASVTKIEYAAFIGTPWLEYMQFRNPYVVVNDILLDASLVVGEAEVAAGIRTIAGGAFKEANIDSVVIAEDVISIGDYAFLDCKSLQTVIMGKNVKEFGQSAFEGTPWLDNLKEENQMVTINKILIDGKNTAGNVIIPDDIIAIADGAFYWNEQIKNITIPESVVYVGENSFYGCINLMHVVVSNSMEVIDDGAFEECDKLRLFTVGDSQDISEFPEELQYIGERAFAGCRNLQNIIITNNVRGFGTGCFQGCTDLKRVTLEEGIGCVGNLCFYGCSSLPEIILPNSIQYLGSQAFATCGLLTDVKLPDDIKEIPSRCFEQCYSMINIEIPDTVQLIGAYAFMDCSSLVKFVLPERIQSISYDALMGCLALEEIIYPENFLEVFGTTFYREYLFGGTAIRWISIPEGVTCINSEAFAECPSLLAIVIPQTVVEIGDKAFANTAISKLKLPDSLIYIGNDIISGCKNLKSIDYPANMVSLWGTVFEESWLWGNEYNVEQISIPEGVTEIAYRTFENCKNLKEVAMPPSVITIGSFAFENCENLKKVILPGNYHTIERAAFYRCKGLEELENEFYTTYIGVSAFESCKKLDTVEFLNAEVIELSAFKFCSGLDSFAVSKKLKELELYAFSSELLPGTFVLYEDPTNTEDYKCYDSYKYFRNDLGLSTPWYW